MTAGEFAFLALGLVLGVASGVSIIEVLHSRPPAPRVVRVTVTRDSVPRRATTLAEGSFVGDRPEPARGGPGDGTPADPLAGDELSRRTTVRLAPEPAASLATVDREDKAAADAANKPADAPADAPAGEADPPLVGVPILNETDPTLEALRAVAARTAEQEMILHPMTIGAILERPGAGAAEASESQSPSTPTIGTPATGASTMSDGRMTEDVAKVENGGSSMADHDSGTDPAATTDPAVTTDPAATDASGDAWAGAAAPSGADDADDGCAEVRRVSEERCSLAGLSREQAQRAHEALRAAQRSYDDHQTRAEQHTADADPRTIRTAKEAAQDAFRQARAAARTREAVETAARDWLTEINRINRGSREAATLARNEREAANELVLAIERLTVEADAARIGAESAEEACLAARQAVADCQEEWVTRRSAQAVPPPHAPGFARTGLPEEETELEAAFSATGGGEPAILRLVRGDREALIRLVDELAGGDPAERRRWQVALGALIEAVVGRAIESSALTFPVDHPFWGAFTISQNRDIAEALSSLGYRFDGLGGWVDERFPSQRDLSLAVGYAGLDPMRIRHWPTEAEMSELFSDVAVAADEYLAGAAGGLTLGELLSALGRRADDLAELWNEWGRVRPLLLAAG